MGHIRHNAIIATCWQDGAAESLADFARRLGAEAVVGGEKINGYRTVCITPDGSNEGWDLSDEGDDQRAKIRQWMRQESERDSDALYFEWCEVAYGADDATACIVDSPWPTEAPAHE